MQASGKTVAVLMPNHFNANLFLTLRDCLVGGGARIVLAGFAAGEPLTDSERKETLTIDVGADELRPGDYDALVILDSATPEEMSASRRNLELISRSYEHQKLLGAVDRGVELLVAAMGDLLSGREVAAPADSRMYLDEVGAEQAERDVAVDKLLITAKSDADVEQFCQVLLEKLQSAGGVAA